MDDIKDTIAYSSINKDDLITNSNSETISGRERSCFEGHTEENQKTLRRSTQRNFPEADA
jgi:hypothetical protein